MKKARRIIVGSTIGVLAIAISLSVFYQNPTRFFPEPTYSIQKHIQYRYTLRNTTNQVIRDAQFWVHAPVKQTGTQLCKKIGSSHPYELITDRIGNQVLHFRFKAIAPLSSKVITIRSDLLMAQKPKSSVLSNLRSYLRAEKNVESDHPQIQKITSQIASANKLKTARDIFDWVSGNLKYTGYSKNNRGALYAAIHKTGDCTEFTHLFVAMCRAADVPARSLGGYICRENTVIKSRDYHNWAEFYQDGRWLISDPQNRIFMTNYPDYIAMRIFGGNENDSLQRFDRFRVLGTGLIAKMHS